MYKIIQNNKVIDVIKYPQFIKFLASGHIAITDKTSANGIVGSDNETVYSFQARNGYEAVTIEEITLKEFERLNGLLSSDQEVCADESVLTNTRQSKIRQLSNQCKAFINAGFSVTLSDDKSYCFKLTAEDQFNLLSIENQLRTGAETFIYHATDLPCRVFVRDDMKKIISAYKKHVLYHTTYFNSAKQYINSLKDIDKIKAFTYGVDITYTISDPVIRKIISSGGVN